MSLLTPNQTPTMYPGVRKSTIYYLLFFVITTYESYHCVKFKVGLLVGEGGARWAIFSSNTDIFKINGHILLKIYPGIVSSVCSKLLKSTFTYHAHDQKYFQFCTACWVAHVAPTPGQREPCSTFTWGKVSRYEKCSIEYEMIKY